MPVLTSREPVQTVLSVRRDELVAVYVPGRDAGEKERLRHRVRRRVLHATAGEAVSGVP